MQSLYTSIIRIFQLSEHPPVTMCSDKWLPISIPSHTYLVVFGSSLLLLLELFVHQGSRGHQPIVPTMQVCWWCSSSSSPSSHAYCLVSPVHNPDHPNIVHSPEWTKRFLGWNWYLWEGRMRNQEIQTVYMTTYKSTFYIELSTNQLMNNVNISLNRDCNWYLIDCLSTWVQIP